METIDDKYARTRRIAFPVFGAYEVTKHGAITKPGDRLVLVGVIARWSDAGLYVTTTLEFRLLRDGEPSADIEMNAATGTARIDSGAYVGLPGYMLPKLELFERLNQPEAPGVLPLVEGRDIWETINGRANPERLRYHAQQHDRVVKGENFFNGVIYNVPNAKQIERLRTI